MSTTISVVQGGDDRGRQNSDAIDLSTCVNAYGPPPILDRCVEKLQHGHLLRLHPFRDEQWFLQGYATWLNVEPSDLVAARGITELIQACIRSLGAANIVYPSPDYTDFHVHLMPGSQQGPMTAEGRLQQLHTSALPGRTVIFSNPCNPTGIAISRHHLLILFAAHGSTRFVVDESYVDFTADPPTWSVTGCDLDNVVVLRSPTKCFGMGGVRVGAAWSRDAAFLRSLKLDICKWPLSRFDTIFALESFAQRSWLDDAKSKLLKSANDMQASLISAGLQVIADVPVHFRFVPHAAPRRIASWLEQGGFSVRVKSIDEGIAGVRIVAPRLESLGALVRYISTTGEAC